MFWKSYVRNSHYFWKCFSFQVFSLVSPPAPPPTSSALPDHHFLVRFLLLEHSRQSLLVFSTRIVRTQIVFRFPSNLYSIVTYILENRSLAKENGRTITDTNSTAVQESIRSAFCCDMWNQWLRRSFLRLEHHWHQQHCHPRINRQCLLLCHQCLLQPYHQLFPLWHHQPLLLCHQVLLPPRCLRLNLLRCQHGCATSRPHCCSYCCAYSGSHGCAHCRSCCCAYVFWIPRLGPLSILLLCLLWIIRLCISHCRSYCCAYSGSHGCAHCRSYCCVYSEFHCLLPCV